MRGPRAGRWLPTTIVTLSLLYLLSPTGGPAQSKAVVYVAPIDSRPAPPKPAHRAAQEGRDRGAFLVAKHLRIGHPRAVVDTDMDEFPADAARLATAIAGDPVAHVTDATELSDISDGQSVETQELARAASHARLLRKSVQPVGDAAGVDGAPLDCDSRSSWMRTSSCCDVARAYS